MTRYTVNASILLTDRPVLERPAAVREAGFEALELWWPFPVAVPQDREVDALVRSVQDAGLALTGLNFFAGDMAGGERGLVCQPGRTQEFRDNIDVVVGIGEQLGCRAFNALYGLRPEEASTAVSDEVALENLVLASRAVARVDGTVLLEPVSGAPAYPLKSAQDALEVITRLQGHDVANARILADFYHLSVNGDDVLAVIAQHAAQFGHVQIADEPGRGAPGTGSLPIGDWIQAASEGGYDGWVGLEYKSSEPDPFAWLPRDQRGADA